MLRKYIDHLAPGSLAIYLFHGVVEENPEQLRNYTRKHILKDEFDDLLSLLKEKGTPLSMQEVAEHCRTNTPFPDHAFAITFDDGFENNLSVAAPVLHRHGLPATFYITTDYISNNTMSWTDKVELCLENVPSGKLKFSWDDREFPFSTLSDKIHIMDYLRGYVKYHPEIDFEEMVRDIYIQLGVEIVEHSDAPLDLKMTWEQVKELDKIPGMTVGGHSHRHIILSFLNDKELQDDILTSLKMMREKLGREVYHYSYPEGLAHCYDERVIRILKNEGIICCPAAIDGVNQIPADPFHLKRVFVV